MIRFIICICLIINHSFQAQAQIKFGDWIGKLQLNSNTELPFRMEILQKNNIPSMTIKNGEERISLLFNRFIGDTLVYSFPQFDSDLYLYFTSKQTIDGYWHNKNKQGRYTIPLNAHYCSGLLFECQATNNPSKSPLDKKWKTKFNTNSQDAFPAIGLFDQNENLVSGTFLTETGDYRYLDGNIFGDKLHLSCFDGSHAFLFTADLKMDTLKGLFFSGSHYQTNWIANPDDDFKLSDPNKLTFVVNENKLTFDFKNLENVPFHYPDSAFKNKVTIIQIMGSWCPNCMDETHYYMDLYKKYHEKGLEIILIGYETGSSEQEYIEKLKRFQTRNLIPFTMLVGGPANKNKAAKDFSMLNQIISFPTSIFVDKAGNISKIHTGFSGPSTGEYYTEYMVETENLIKKLLQD